VSPKWVAACRWRRSDGTVSHDDSRVGVLETLVNRAGVGRRAGRDAEVFLAELGHAFAQAYDVTPYGEEDQRKQ
jgi:hypothetical protein